MGGTEVMYPAKATKQTMCLYFVVCSVCKRRRAVHCDAVAFKEKSLGEKFYQCTSQKCKGARTKHYADT